MTEPAAITAARDMLRAYYNCQPLPRLAEQLAEALAQWRPAEETEIDGMLLAETQRCLCEAMAENERLRAALEQATKLVKTSWAGFIEPLKLIPELTKERELLRRLQNFLQVNEHRFELWERAHDSRAPKTIDRAGFKKRFFNGSPFNSMSDAAAHLGTEEPTTAMQEGLTMSFYVFPDVFLREVVGEADKSFAHRVLVERGILRTEKNGVTKRPYRRERIPGGALTKMYVIAHTGLASINKRLRVLEELIK